MRTTLIRIDPVDERAVEAAVTDPVFAELFEEIVAVAPDTAAVVTGFSSGARTHGHLAPRVLLTAAAAVLVLVGALAGAGVLGSRNRPSSPFSTSWHAAHAMKIDGSEHRAGTWRLVDDLLTGTWQQNDYGPPPGYLTCATAGRCYVMAGKYPSATAGAPLLSESLYLTSDQGAGWTMLPMPPGFDPTTALACAGATWCAAGGTYQGQPVLLTSPDGGHTFRVTPLPTGVGALHALACPAAGACDGLVASSTGSLTAPLDATFLTVTGGGAAFGDRPILPGSSMVALACTTAEDCTVVGETDSTMNAVVPTSVAAVTTDAGAEWTTGSVPTGFGIKGNLTRLACANATRCIVTGQVAIKNAKQCGITQPDIGTGSAGPSLTSIAMSPAVRAISGTESQIAATWAHKTLGAGGVSECSSGSVTEVSVVATSSDGGRSWTPEALPNDVPNPQLDGLSCATATECWISGSESLPQKIGRAVDEGSPVLLGTTDAGATWSKVTFNVAATAPNPTGQSYLTIGAVSCPSAGICLAKGSGAQGADVSPIYSLVIPAH